ncbi:actin-related protein 2/3 complex subunit 3 [Lipomyces tetrasporus]|uniref:Actin-related protein 2/3 complex subunit 3 n=1 Tax=Lipomyces tetrasporus TaxID=54092 RepID=A0AAD7QZX0_9ASCO|nr:actin-related protein 2/3 complex subunit 3 [Lipomyces tetrasporus]KAJ8104283.1 actin-related protein 2/3 complex subunit 3 [Lipomyces tetrasporus]
MPAYHSTFLSEPETRVVGNFAVLPLRTKFRGPAYPTSEDYDIIDEVLDLFRANSFFRNFEIKGPADRALIYGILFISDCLSALSARVDRNEAARILNTLALDHFSIPGEPGFPLNSLYAAPRDRAEAELLRGYLSQFRQELALRLAARVYAEGDKPSKYWLAFTRRRFMNKSLS